MHFGRLVARAGGVIAKMATAHAPMAGAIRSVPCADAAGPRRANIRVLTAGDRPGGPDAATAPRWRCPQYLLTRIGDSGCSGIPVRPAVRHPARPRAWMARAIGAPPLRN